MKKNTVLLTGATGFLGSHILEVLLKKGYPVVVLKRSTSNLWRIQHLTDRYKSYNVDNLQLEQAFKEQTIDCVIHTACHYGRNGDPVSEIVESNLLYSLRVLDACIKFNVGTFINTDTFFNSRHVTQKYLGAYTLSKKQLIDWLEYASCRVQVLNLKLHHLFGPKDDISKFIPWFVSQLQNNAEEIKLSSGKQKRDFIHVDDAVRAYISILQNRSNFEQYEEIDIGTGNVISLKCFLISLLNTFKAECPTLKTKLSFGSMSERVGEIMDVEVNNAALLNLGWRPKVSLESGLKQIIKYKF